MCRTAFFGPSPASAPVDFFLSGPDPGNWNRNRNWSRTCLVSKQRQQKETFSIMGNDTLSIHAAQHWFNRFKSSNFELDDSRHSGRPLPVDVDVLKQLTEEDPRLTTCCLAERLGCSHTTVETHLNEMSKRWKYGVWIPHELSSHQLQLVSCVTVTITHDRD